MPKLLDCSTVRAKPWALLNIPSSQCSLWCWAPATAAPQSKGFVSLEKLWPWLRVQGSSLGEEGRGVITDEYQGKKSRLSTEKQEQSQHNLQTFIAFEDPNNSFMLSSISKEKKETFVARIYFWPRLGLGLVFGGAKVVSWYCLSQHQQGHQQRSLQVGKILFRALIFKNLRHWFASPCLQRKAIHSGAHTQDTLRLSKNILVLT